jgi:UDP-glucose 4-epimerase
MRVLITGANGFVGRALVDELATAGHTVVCAVRRCSDLPNEVLVDDLGPKTEWGRALVGCDAVVHLAARVHVMRDEASDPLTEFRRVNTEGTLRLARQAAQAGVRRFVFISSVKVNGEGREQPYRETDAAAPEDAYAISKWEAEQGLQMIGAEVGLEIVILRPPLVYGPGVKANFRRLIQTVARGWPLPLGAIHNRRSLLYLGNFVDAICLCVKHPEAVGQTFLLDDGEAVSTPELVGRLAHALGRPTRLVAVPVGLLEVAAVLLGKRAAVTRLTQSLYVDSSAIRSRTAWAPPYTLQQGLAATVIGWRANASRVTKYE